jgi:hypothetical protein
VLACSIFEYQAEQEEVIEELDESDSLVLATIDPNQNLPPSLCTDEDTDFIIGMDIFQPPRLEEPAARRPYRDPTFDICLVRVTDRKNDPMPGDPSRGMKNEYARVNSFNADGSRLLVYSIDGYWYLYDSASLRPMGTLPIGEEPRWDAQDPHVLYFIDELRLMSYDIDSGGTQILHNFSGNYSSQSISAVWTRHEGRPSMDTRYFGLMVEDEEFIPSAFLIYDRIEDRIVSRDVRTLDGIQDDVDHVTISPLGTYFLASFDRYCPQGALGNDAHPCGLMVYDRNLQNGRSLLRIIGHYDVALDENGREIVIFQDIDKDQISILNLESGEVTALFDIDFSHTAIGFHFSGLAYEQPGWALISTYEGGYPQAYTWMDDQVFAVELRAGGRVIRLASTHSKVDPNQGHDYWAEPHATVNRDFTRILFTSNWGRSGTEQVDMYMMALPLDWSALLP